MANILEILGHIGSQAYKNILDAEISEAYAILLSNIQRGEGLSRKVELSDAMDQFELLEHAMGISKNSEKLTLYAAGMLKMMVQYSLDMIRYQAEIEKLAQLKHQHKHLESILFFLENHPFAKQKQIALKLNISTNNLSNVLKRIKSLNFILPSKVGNSTAYTLTPGGLAAVKMLRSEAEPQTTLNYITCLLDEITKVVKYGAAYDGEEVVRRAMMNSIRDLPEEHSDPEISKRVSELLSHAKNKKISNYVEVSYDGRNAKGMWPENVVPPKSAQKRFAVVGW